MYYDINKRINELNIPLKMIYDNVNNEKQFVEYILNKYPILIYENRIEFLEAHFHTVYYGFTMEDKIREAIEPYYNVNSRLDLDFNYRIDILVDNEIGIQVKSVKYLDKELKVIKYYLDTIGNKIRQLEVSSNHYILIFYDTKNNDKLYCITYEVLYRIINGLINLKVEVQPSFKLEKYKFCKYKHCFNDIGFIDSPSLGERLKNVIDKIKEP